MHRTVLTATIMVETASNETDHQKAVEWAANRVKYATSPIKGGYVATKVVARDTGLSYGVSTYGQSPSMETKMIEADLFDEKEGNTA